MTMTTEMLAIWQYQMKMTMTMTMTMTKETMAIAGTNLWPLSIRFLLLHKVSQVDGRATHAILIVVAIIVSMGIAVIMMSMLEG